MEDGGSIIFQLFGVLIALVIAIVVARDAKQRGMSGLGWGIITFLICIIAIPIYLVVRKPRLDERQ